MDKFINFAMLAFFTSPAVASESQKNDPTLFLVFIGAQVLTIIGTIWGGMKIQQKRKAKKNIIKPSVVNLKKEEKELVKSKPSDSSKTKNKDEEHQKRSSLDDDLPIPILESSPPNNTVSNVVKSGAFSGAGASVDLDLSKDLDLDLDIDFDIDFF